MKLKSKLHTHVHIKCDARGKCLCGYDKLYNSRIPKKKNSDKLSKLIKVFRRKNNGTIREIL